MRHLNAGRKLGMGAHRRKALFRTMTMSLIEHETIRTTPARAKELRWYADRVVTLAKKGDLHSRRQIVKLLGSTQTHKTGENRVRKVLESLYSNLAPRFKDRQGGYTQMIRLAKRRAGDNAEMVVFRYLPDAASEAAGGKKAKAPAKKKAAPKVAKKAKAAATDKPAAAKKSSKKTTTPKSKAKKEA